MGKPEKMLDKIIEGKMNKFYKESCLMNQMYVRDTSLTISDVLNDMIAKTGEKITINRFARYQIGGVNSFDNTKIQTCFIEIKW